MGKSKRNSGPKNDSRRAELLAARQAEREAVASAPTRPFAGWASECDLVAMREFVASATAPLTVTGSDRRVTLATVLPGAVATLVREPGEAAGAVAEAFVALQVQRYGADPAVDLRTAVALAGTIDPGTSIQTVVGAEAVDGAAVLDVTAPLEITVHRDFGWWIPEGTTAEGDVAMAIEQANAAIMPTARIEADGVDAAWWVDAGAKAHIRWVRPEDEDELMVALARLQAAGSLDLGEGSRFAGSFRTHGLLVPVFDLDPEVHPNEWAAGTKALGARLEETLADTSPMTTEQRRARDGLRSRQVTLR